MSYDPTIGRWLSEDPIGFAAGDANLSRYVGNSPTMYTDPTGLDSIGGGPSVPLQQLSNQTIDADIDELPPWIMAQVQSNPSTAEAKPSYSQIHSRSSVQLAKLEGPIPVEAEWDIEKRRIIEEAKAWFKWYTDEKIKKQGRGWPKDKCEDQATSLDRWLREKAPKGGWNHWNPRGVSGWRWGYFNPPGQRPMFRETENAVGVFPHGDNPRPAFIIDGFHGYGNGKTDIKIYENIEDFFDIWPHGRDEDSWTPKPPLHRPMPFPPTKMCCFAAGTPVMTPLGIRSIETMELGEPVLTRDVERGRIVRTCVTSLDIHSGEFEMLRLHLKGRSSLEVTKGHFFWCDGRWVPSEELRDGELVTDYHGRLQPASVVKEYLYGASVYNIQTESGTYLVGEYGLLVSGVVADQSLELVFTGSVGER